MAQTIALADIVVSAVTATAITGTLAQANITDADRQTLYIVAAFDDQGDSSARVITATWNGVDISAQEVKRNTITGPYVGLFRVTNPTGTGGLASFTISSAPAFNNRHWAVGFIVVNDNNQTTPNDTILATENAALTSLSTGVPTDLTDIVMSIAVVDNKTMANVGANSPTTAHDEDSGLGGFYMGIASWAGTGGTVNTNWGNGSGAAWSGTTIAIEFAFALNEDTGSGGGAGPSLAWLPRVQVVRGPQVVIIPSGFDPGSSVG
jgi:hypothetical protein